MYEAGIGEMAARVDKKETSAKVKLRLELNVQLFEVILLASPKPRNSMQRKELIPYQHCGISVLHILLAFFATSQIGAVIVAGYAIRGSTKSRPCPRF